MANTYDDFEPSESIEDPITAAGNPLAGGNSRLARSLRARRQLRDRKGRFIKMGGGVNFKLRMAKAGRDAKGRWNALAGRLLQVSGRSVGASDKVKDGVQVHITNDPSGLPDGFYTVPATSTEVSQALLSQEQLKRSGIKAEYEGDSTDSGVIDFKDVTFSEAPEGWEKQKDGSFRTLEDDIVITPTKDGKYDLSEGGNTLGVFDSVGDAIVEVNDRDSESELSEPEKKKVAELRSAGDEETAKKVIRNEPVAELPEGFKPRPGEEGLPVPGIAPGSQKFPEYKRIGEEKTAPKYKEGEDFDLKDMDKAEPGTILNYEHTIKSKDGKNVVITNTYKKNDDGSWTNLDDGSNATMILRNQAFDPDGYVGDYIFEGVGEVAGKQLADLPAASGPVEDYMKDNSFEGWTEGKNWRGAKAYTSPDGKFTITPINGGRYTLSDNIVDYAGRDRTLRDWADVQRLVGIRLGVHKDKGPQLADEESKARPANSADIAVAQRAFEEANARRVANWDSDNYSEELEDEYADEIESLEELMTALKDGNKLSQDQQGRLDQAKKDQENADSKKPKVERKPDSLGESVQLSDEDRQAMQDSAITSQHLDENGEFTPERKALHEAIIASHFDNVTPVDDPNQFMNGGGPGSGKGTFTGGGSNADQVDYDPNSVVLDPDKIKEMFPEVQEAIARIRAGEGTEEDYEWAAISHEESSYLTKRVHQAALDRGTNIVIDGTGDGGYDSLKKKVDKARESGAKRVEANYMYLEPGEGVKRALKREAESTRRVPRAVIENTYNDISSNFPRIIEDDLFDTVRVFDNNGVGKGEQAPLIYEKIDGVETIYDQEAYDRFLAAKVTPEGTTEGVVDVENWAGEPLTDAEDAARGKRSSADIRAEIVDNKLRLDEIEAEINRETSSDAIQELVLEAQDLEQINARLEQEETAARTAEADAELEARRAEGDTGAPQTVEAIDRNIARLEAEIQNLYDRDGSQELIDAKEAQIEDLNAQRDALAGQPAEEVVTEEPVATVEETVVPAVEGPRTTLAPLSEENPDAPLITDYDKNAYVPGAEGLPEGTTDDPKALANIFDPADLGEAFKNAVKNGEGLIPLEFPDGATANIRVEAVRDALQYQGIDTDWYQSEIFDDPDVSNDVANPNGDEPGTPEAWRNGIRPVSHDELANAYDNLSALESEQAFVSANEPENVGRIETLKRHVRALRGRIQRLEALGLRNIFETKRSEPGSLKWAVGDPDVVNPDLIMDALKDHFSELDGIEVMPNGDLKLGEQTYESNGKKFTYEVFVTKTDDETFYPFIRETNHAETDPAKKYRSIRMGTMRQSAKATVKQAQEALDKLNNVAKNSNIISWFKNYQRAQRYNAGTIPKFDLIDADGNPQHIKDRVMTRQAMDNIRAATSVEEITDELINVAYNMIAQLGNSNEVLYELNQHAGFDMETLNRFVDAINTNLHVRDHLERYKLWESSNGTPIMEGDIVEYTGDENQTGNGALSGRKGVVKVRALEHTVDGYTYTDYVYIKLLDENGNETTEETRPVASHNLTLISTKGGTDGSERVGPNAISLPLPVLTTRGVNRYATRNRLRDVAPYVSDYDRGTLANPTITIDGKQYPVQASRGTTITESLNHFGATVDQLAVGDFIPQLNPETKKMRLAEIVGIDENEDGSRTVHTVLPIDLGSAEVSSTSYPADFDATFDIYREDRANAVPVDMEGPITRAHIDRLVEALRGVDIPSLDADLLDRLSSILRSYTRPEESKFTRAQFADILQEVIEAQRGGAGTVSIQDATDVLQAAIRRGGGDQTTRNNLARARDSALVRGFELDDEIATANITNPPAPMRVIPSPARQTTSNSAVVGGTTPDAQWFTDATPGSQIVLMDTNGTATRSDIITMQEDGTWRPTNGGEDDFWETSEELSTELSFSNYDNARIFSSNQPTGPAPLELNTEFPEEGDIPDDEWLQNAGEGSNLIHTREDGSVEMITRTAEGVWLGDQGDEYTPDELSGLREMGPEVGEELVVGDTSIPSEQFSSTPTRELATSDWVRNAQEGEILLRDFGGSYRVLKATATTRGIEWVDQNTGTSPTSSEALANFIDGMSPEDGGYEIAGPDFYIWSPQEDGTLVSDPRWVKDSPDGTVVSFYDSNDRELRVAEKLFDGSWQITDSSGENVDILSNEALWIDASPEIYVGAFGDGEERNVDENGVGGTGDLPYEDIAVGPYTTEQGQIQMPLEDFRRAVANGDMATIQNELMSIFGNRRFGSRFRIADLSVTPMGTNGFAYTAVIDDENGDTVGHVTRYIYFTRSVTDPNSNGGYVEHASMSIYSDSDKRTGFAKEYKQMSDDFYNSLGLEKINIGTAADGRVVWAKMNYTWGNRYSAQYMADRVDALLADALRQGRNKDAKVLQGISDRFKLDFNDANYPDPIDLAYLTYQDGQEMAKDIFYTGWSGVRYLRPEADPRPQNRKDKTPADYKPKKADEGSPLTDEENKASASQDNRIDADGTVLDKSYFVNAEDGDMIIVDRKSSQAVLVRKDGQWIDTYYGSQSKEPKDYEITADNDDIFEKYDSENPDQRYTIKKIVDPDEFEKYNDFYNGFVEEVDLDRQGVIDALVNGDKFALDSWLINGLFENGDANFGPYHGGNFGSYFSTDWKGKSYFFWADLLDENGNYHGTVERHIKVDDDGDLRIEHSLLQLKDTSKGTGFGTAFSEASEEFYKKSGADYITLTAAWDGSYVWGKAGYFWDFKNYDKATALGDITDGLLVGLKEAQRLGHKQDEDALRGFIQDLISMEIDDPDFPSPYDLATYQSETGDPDFMRNLMYGTDWHGIKMLGSAGKTGEEYIADQENEANGGVPTPADVARATNASQGIPEFDGWEFVETRESSRAGARAAVDRIVARAIENAQTSGFTPTTEQIAQLRAQWYRRYRAQYQDVLVYRKGNLTIEIDKSELGNDDVESLMNTLTELDKRYKPITTRERLIRFNGESKPDGYGTYGDFAPYYAFGEELDVINIWAPGIDNIAGPGVADLAPAAKDLFDNTNIVSYIIAHEYGHMFDYSNIQFEGEITGVPQEQRKFDVLSTKFREYVESKNPRLWDNVSGYASSYKEQDKFSGVINVTNTYNLETFAEAFAQMASEDIHGATPTEIGTIMRDFLTEQGLI